MKKDGKPQVAYRFRTENHQQQAADSPQPSLSYEVALILRIASPALLGTLLLGLLGCGGGGPAEAIKRKPTHPVKGSLTINKKPVEGVRVTLYPLNLEDRSGDFWTKGFPGALTKEDGSFVISTYNPDDGAPAGEYLVLSSKMEGEGEAVKDLLLSRYMNPQTAKQRIMVKEQNSDLAITLTK